MANETTYASLSDSRLSEILAAEYDLLLASRTRLADHPALLYGGSITNTGSNVIKRPTEAELDEAVLHAQEMVHKMGVTAIHDLDGRQGFGTLQRLRARGRLRLRAVSHVAMEELEVARRLLLPKKKKLSRRFLAVVGGSTKSPRRSGKSRRLRWSRTPPT